MRVGEDQSLPARPDVRTAKLQLAAKVRPLVGELTVIERQSFRRPGGVDLFSREVIPPRICLVDNCAEIVPDRGSGVVHQLESPQLGMVGVSPAGFSDYCLGEESFAPACREGLAVEVARMHRPQSHCAFSIDRSASRRMLAAMPGKMMPWNG